MVTRDAYASKKEFILSFHNSLRQFLHKKFLFVIKSVNLCITLGNVYLLHYYLGGSDWGGASNDDTLIKDPNESRNQQLGIVGPTHRDMILSHRRDTITQT